jgi:hypothetical protein
MGRPALCADERLQCFAGVQDFLEHNAITLGRSSNAGRAAVERRTVHNLNVQSDIGSNRQHRLSDQVSGNTAKERLNKA